MPDLTEEEYNILDEYYTQNPPKVNPAKSGTGFFTRRKAAAARSITVDPATADYLLTRAAAAGKTPAEIISDMVHHEMEAASAVIL